MSLSQAADDEPGCGTDLTFDLAKTSASVKGVLRDRRRYRLNLV